MLLLLLALDERAAKLASVSTICSCSVLTRLLLGALLIGQDFLPYFCIKQQDTHLTNLE
jgi:hypothetical protein